jgi:hypothetical protein
MYTGHRVRTEIMDQDLTVYDDHVQAEFRHFMQLGARMFAPKVDI